MLQGSTKPECAVSMLFLYHGLDLYFFHSMGIETLVPFYKKLNLLRNSRNRKRKNQTYSSSPNSLSA